MDIGINLKGQPGSNTERYTLVIGDDAHLSIVMAMASKLGWGARCRRFVSVEEAREFAAGHEVDRVISINRDGTASLVDQRGRKVPCIQASEILRRTMGRIPLSEVDTRQLEEALSHPRPYYPLIKRAIDILASAVALAIIAIPLLGFAVVTRIVCNVWPTVQRQVVIGRDGKPFELPRITIGRASQRERIGIKRARLFLTATGLERYPILFMVFIGRMSLVGPRPATPDAFERGLQLSDAFALRTLVRPGLLGLSQVRSFRLNAGRDERVAIEYDLYYLAFRSLWLDARIIGRGLIVLGKSWGRYALGLVRGMGRRISAGYRKVYARIGPARLATVPLPVDQFGVPRQVDPCIVVGAGAGGRLLVRELTHRTSSRYWPIAIVDDDPSLIGTRIENVPVVGNVDSLPAISELEQVDLVVIAAPSANGILTQRVSQLAQTRQLRVLTMPSVGGILHGESAVRLKPVQTSDLLGRPVVEADPARAKAFLSGKRVLVTGAAGSIGSEVVRQAMLGEPATIIGLDNNESGLFDLQHELAVKHPDRRFIPVVASVVDAPRIDTLMRRYAPNVVFHAAAYKHVPLMEAFPYEAVITNIKGTAVMADAAVRLGVERFVMVSTDKAVRPSSVMGASKRIAELIVRDAALNGSLSACSVRFGNVLGSRGSVIPLFEKQIAEGGPVTITDAGMTRYFMTIPEAANLIIEAGAFGDEGVTYMLDMGEPVRIVDVAERLIRMHDKEPGVDIDIVFTGLRPGEKLFEELSLDFESARETDHPKIRILDEVRSNHRISAAEIVERLETITHHGPRAVRAAVMQAVREADGGETAQAAPPDDH